MSETTFPQIRRVPNCTRRWTRCVPRWAGHVLTGDDALEFRDPYYCRAWPEFDASAVVQPSCVEEVQAVLRIANAY